VIVGHKAAGEFDPQNWMVLMQGERPAGVLILSRVPASDALELTYIGLAPFARGRGIASELMKLAIRRTAELGCERLTTAADAQNRPALTMYVRAGMRRLGSRLALIRVIHRDSANSSTIHPQETK
jgi:RimJ/RimL family protein N-acetyltransferase